MFNFYVDLAGHDMVTDASGTTTCWRKIKPHDYEQKVQKMKDLSKTWVLKRKQFEDFRQKKDRNIILNLSKHPVERTALKNNNWIWPL